MNTIMVCGQLDNSIIGTSCFPNQLSVLHTVPIKYLHIQINKLHTWAQVGLGRAVLCILADIDSSTSALVCILHKYYTSVLWV